MDWDIANITEIVSYINKELAAGRKMNDIEKVEFGVNDRVIHKRLVRLYYRKVDNQYTCTGNAPESTTEKKVKKTSPKTKDVIKASPQAHISPIERFLDESNIKSLLELIALVEPIKAILERDKIESNVIDVCPIELKVKSYTNVKAKTVKADVAVLDRFEKYLKENNQYKAQDLLSQALEEFLDKYNL